jgi:hypothetical protein
MKVLLGANSAGLRMIERRYPLGVSHFCSWARLEEELRRSGEIKSSEKVSAFVLNDAGITIRFE